MYPSTGTNAISPENNSPGAGGSEDDEGRRIVAEFVHLLEKSKQVRQQKVSHHFKGVLFCSVEYILIFTCLWLHFAYAFQLFNGLRDLPPYGHKQWQGYFGRTFDVYTKLWKFQQQHRSVLDTRYGLKRWQIGEIASKIGQLYYHY